MTPLVSPGSWAAGVAARAARLGELADQGTAVTAQVSGIRATAERQAAILDALDGLDQQVAALADRITDLAERGGGPAGGGYQPSPTPRWWKLDGQERAVQGRPPTRTKPPNEMGGPEWSALPGGDPFNAVQEN